MLDERRVVERLPVDRHPDILAESEQYVERLRAVEFEHPAGLHEAEEQPRTLAIVDFDP